MTCGLAEQNVPCLHITTLPANLKTFSRFGKGMDDNYREINTIKKAPREMERPFLPFQEPEPKEHTVLYKTNRVYPRLSKYHTRLCESPPPIPFSLNLETWEREAAATAPTLRL